MAKKLKHFEIMLGDKWAAWQEDDNTQISLSDNKVTISMTRELEGVKRKMTMFIDLTGRLLPYVIA